MLDITSYIAGWLRLKKSPSHVLPFSNIFLLQLLHVIELYSLNYCFTTLDHLLVIQFVCIEREPLKQCLCCWQTDSCSLNIMCVS